MTLNSKRISDYFIKDRLHLSTAEDQDLHMEMATSKKLKTSQDQSYIQSQKSTCEKASKCSDNRLLLEECYSQQSLNLEEIDLMLSDKLKSQQEASHPQTPTLNLKSLLNALPFATADFAAELKVKSLVYQHCRSKVVPTSLSTLLIPSVPIFGQDTSLLSCIMLLTGVKWVEKLEESLKEYNKMTIFKEDQTKQTAGYLMKIEISHRANMKKYLEVDPVKFLEVLGVEAQPIEPVMSFMRSHINDNNVLEEYLRSRESQRKFFNFNSLISAAKVEPTKTKTYWSFNSQDYCQWPHDHPYIGQKNKSSQLGSTYNIQYESLPPRMLELFILEHLILYLMKENGLLDKDDNLWALNIIIRFYHSSNPYFYFGDLLFGLFKYDEASLSFFSKNEPDLLLQSLFVDGNSLDTKSIKAQIFTKLCAFRPILIAKQSKLNALVIHNNANKPQRVENIGTKLSICFQKAEDLTNWLPKNSNGVPIIPKEKADVDTLILKPALLAISRNELTAEECFKYISKQFLCEDSKAGEEIRQKLRYIKASLFNLENEVGSTGSFKERRVVFAEFLTNFVIEGVSYEEEITDILIHPHIEEIYLAIEEFLLLSLGPEFVYYYLHMVIAFDQSTLLTKGPGLLVVGGSNLGKSTFFSLLLKPFEKLYLTNTRTQNITSNKPIPDNKTLEIDAHVIVKDDFSPGFDKMNKMSTPVFNLMNDWTRRSWTIPIKNFQCFLKKKCPIWVICHHSLEVLMEHHDESFFSRFSCIVNFNDPIIKSKNLPQRQHNESEEAYMSRLVELGLANPRPLFPLRLRNNNIFAEFNTKLESMNTQLFKNIGTCPLPSKTSQKFKAKVLDRESELVKNPLSKKWLHLPEVSEVQCSYLINKVMVSLFDRIFAGLSEGARENIFPLQSARSLLDENVKQHGLEFSHAALNPRVFNISKMIVKPTFLESPQGLVRAVVEEIPGVIASKFGDL